MPQTKKKRYWVGFDLGGTKMLAGVFDAELQAAGRARRKNQARAGAKTVLERMLATIDEALIDAGVSKEKLAGIGVGIPGPLDPSRGVILHAPNLGWKDFQLRKPLEESFKCPVHIMNDVDAGLYGEFRFGAAQNARCAIGVFPGTGIGGSCVYEGRVLTGTSRSCFEIGHMQVLPGGPLCGCGQCGCLEAVAGRLAISAAAAAAVYRGEAPHLQALAGADLFNIRSGPLADAVRAGDSVVERIIREAARWLGIGVANVINLLAPDIVVLGGGLVEAMPELFLEEVSSGARRRVMTPFRDVFKVVVSGLGDDAVAHGAAAWAEENVRAARKSK